MINVYYINLHYSVSKKLIFLFFTIFLLVLLISSGCSKGKIEQFREISWVDYIDKVEGGWLGQMIGVQFGAPTEGVWQGEIIPFDLDDYCEFDRKTFREIPSERKKAFRDDKKNWKKIELDGFPENDDIYIELVFLNGIRTYGVDVIPREMAEDWIRYIPGNRIWCANKMAWENFNKGIFPPQSGHPEFSSNADDIDFQIEADLFGLISPGMPLVSNEWCDRIGHMMNYGDGVYGGCFVAGMYAAAFFENDVEKVVELGLQCIPTNSDYGQMVQDVLNWHKQYPDWKDTWQRVYEKWYKTRMGKPVNTVDVRVNGAYILIGLLYGKGDFWKTMNISMRCGMDSDCNPSNAVGILGCMLGASKIPEKWKVPMKDFIINESLKEVYPEKILRKEIVDATAVIGKEMVLKNGGKFENDVLYIPYQTPKPAAFEQSYLIWEKKGKK